MGTQRDTLGNEWQESVFDGRGFPLYYYHTIPPSPRPKLMFLHAFSSAGPNQLMIFAPLADAFQIYLPTARGHSKSTPIPEGSFTMDYLIDDVAALIRHISPSEPIFLVGHSMGGSTAARVAKKYPELIHALALEDPPWRVPAGTDFDPAGGGPVGFLEAAKKIQALPDDEFEKITGLGMFELLERFGGKPPGGPGGRGGGRGPPGGRGGRGPGGPGGRGRGGGGPGEATDGPFAQSKAEDFKLLAADIIMPTFLDKAEKYISVAVDGIQVPTLLMTGEPGKAHQPPEVTKATLPTYPKGEERNFPGAGHGIHAPPRDGEYRDAIREFFAKFM